MNFAIYDKRGISGGSGLLVQSSILLITGVIISIVLLWSLVPKRVRFSEPGVELKLEAHPRLREEIQEVTRWLGEEAPDALYLSSEANAWVGERGGWIGIKSRRVMCLGLPLLAVFSIDEFRGLIAHECAHFYTGDTWLGPRVYSARSAVLRVIDNLSGESALGDILQRFGLGRALYVLVTLVLTQYWKLFSLIVHYVSRLQEYRSDELAAYIAGAQAVMSGLGKIKRAQMVQDTFWADVVYPAVQGGILPHIGQSFQEFAASPAIGNATQEIYREMLQHSTIDPHSTHPPLSLRLQRLSKLCGETGEQESGPAIALLDDLEVLERALIARIFDDVDAVGLERTGWDQVGSKVYLVRWQGQVELYRQVLSRYTVARIPDLLSDPSTLIVRMRDPEGTLLTREQRVDNARELVWQALALKLIGCGWKLETSPGLLCLVKDDHRISPAELIRSILSGKLEATEWQMFCETHSLTEHNLAES